MAGDEWGNLPGDPAAGHRRARRSSGPQRWKTVVGVLLGSIVIAVLTLGGRAYLFANASGVAIANSRHRQIAQGRVSPPPTATASPTATPGLSANALFSAGMGCASGPPAPQARPVYRGVYAGHSAPNEVALTFDDGPVPATTLPIVVYLERTHTPATFFLLGNEAQAAPDLVRREWHDGFALGVHTWNHPNMARLGSAAQRAQLQSTLNVLHAVLGNDACIWFWRPPYGSYTARTLAIAHTLGLTTVVWDDDTRDWSRPGTAAIVRTALAEAHAGGIILLHDGPAQREETLAALPAILAGLHARGLKPVTLPRLLMDGGYPGVHVSAPRMAPATAGTGTLGTEA